MTSPQLLHLQLLLRAEKLPQPAHKPMSLSSSLKSTLAAATAAATFSSSMTTARGGGGGGGGNSGGGKSSSSGSKFSFSMTKPSNPFCLVSSVMDVGTVMGIRRKPLGCTEVLMNTSNPEWATVLLVPYDPTAGGAGGGIEPARIALDIFSTSRPETLDPQMEGSKEAFRGIPDPPDSEQIAGLIVDVSTLFATAQQQIQQQLLNNPNCVMYKLPGSADAKIFIQVEVTKVGGYNMDEVLRFQLRGLQLPNVRFNFLDRPSYYFEIRRKCSGTRSSVQDGYMLVYRSRVARDTVNPMWDLEEMPLYGLCNFDYSRDLRITLLDDKGNCGGGGGDSYAGGPRAPQLLGWVDTTLQCFLDAKSLFGNSDTSNAYHIQNHHGSRAKNNRLGQLVVAEAEIRVATSYGGSRRRQGGGGAGAGAGASAVDVPVGGGCGAVAAARNDPTTMKMVMNAQSRGVVTGSRGNDELVVEAEVVPVSVLEIMPPPPMSSATSVSSSAVSGGGGGAGAAADFDEWMRLRPCHLEVCVGIDFSSHNGEDYRMPGSPHHIASSSSSSSPANDYEWILSVLGDAYGGYTIREEYPMWGFGGQFGGRQVDLFQCGAAPKARGTAGMRKAYRTAVTKTGVVFSPRRTYQQVLQGALSHAQRAKAEASQRGSLTYTVLVILTTGPEDDIMACKDRLLTAMSSAAPLSVLFVHVDNGRSSSFGDVKLLTYLDMKQQHRSAKSFCACLDGKMYTAGRQDTRLAHYFVSKLQSDVREYYSLEGVP